MNTRQNDTDTSVYSLNDFLTTLFRHKKKVVLFPLFVFALATLIILFAPRKYRSEAKLFLQVGRETVKLDPTATTGDTISLQQSSRAYEIVTVTDVLQSRGVISQVVEKLGPEFVLGQVGPGAEVDSNALADAVGKVVGQLVGLIKSIDPISDREKAIILIEHNLEVEAEHESTLIAIRCDAKTPELAQAVTQALVDVYRQEHLRLHRTSGSRQFFEEQFSDIQKQLDQAVGLVREAKNRMGVASIESRRGTLESRLGNVELSRYQTQQRITATAALTAALTQQLQAIPERMISERITAPNTGADSLHEQLYAVQVRLLELESKYSAKHPLVIAAREQEKKAESMVEEEAESRLTTTDDVNPNHRALKLQIAQSQSDLAGYQAQMGILNDQREAVLAEQKQLNNFEIEIDRLNREVQLARTDYFRYAENLEQARIDEELDKQRITNLNIAQQATLNEKPVSPSKLIVVVLSFLLAMAGTVFCVFGSEKLGDRIYTAQQLEQATRLPVLAAIPDSSFCAKLGA